MSNIFRINGRCSVQRELALAIRNDNFFEVKYLIERCGANPRGYECLADTVSHIDVPNTQNGLTMAEYAGRTCENHHILHLLFQHGMDPTKTMIGCIKRRNIFGVIQCILHGANVNYRYKRGRTLLYTLVKEQIDHPVWDNCAITTIIGILFHCGYKDENREVRTLLHEAKDPCLREILHVADASPEELSKCMRAYVFDYNVYYPAKNPANYYSSGVLDSYKSPEY